MKKISAKTLLQMFPKNVFSELSKKYGGDYKVKKLPAHVVFLTILETLIAGLSFSLRGFASNFNRARFQKRVLKNKKRVTIHHTSFHHRLNKIPCEHFKDIFEIVKKIFSKHLVNHIKKHPLVIFDSTIVTISDLLLKNGFSITSSGNKMQVKFTMGYSGFPIIVELYTDKKYNSENYTLGETILGNDIPKDAIILFDRGLQQRSTFDQLTSKKIFFIGRLKLNYRGKVVKKITQNLKDNIIKELQVYLYERGRRKTKFVYHVVHAIHTPKKDSTKRTQSEEIVFVTNIPVEVMSAEEIAAAYRKRWEIEVFFRFIKQNLHFSHLVNRTKNGIKSIMYIVLTYAIILLAYKKLNNLTGYTYVKEAFMRDFLEEPATLADQKTGRMFRLQFW